MSNVIVRFVKGFAATFLAQLALDMPNWKLTLATALLLALEKSLNPLTKYKGGDKNV